MSARGAGSPATGSAPTDSEAADGESLSNIEEIGQRARENGADLHKDEVFELLKNPRRRMVIRYLKENGEDGGTLSDIAEHIASVENDIPVSQLSSDQRKRVYIGLYQCHLPKMDKFGVIEYDKNRGTVQLQDSVAQLEEYMDTPTDESRDYTHLSLGTAVFVSAIVLLGVLEVGLFSQVPALAWAVVSIGGVFGVALLQLLSN